MNCGKRPKIPRGSHYHKVISPGLLLHCHPRCWPQRGLRELGKKEKNRGEIKGNIRRWAKKGEEKQITWRGV